MPLRDLKRAYELNWTDGPDPFDDPRVLQDYNIQALELDATPLHPDWVPNVFYDPERFPNAVACERIRRHYAKTLPGRDVRLEALLLADMSRKGFTKYPLVEETFRRRGFVADTEITSFERKDHHPETRYLIRHKAAVCLQLTIIDHFLNRPAASPAWVEWRKTQLLALQGGSKRLPLPLVERDGVFLPARALRRREEVHLAYVWATDLALAYGHRDEEGLLAAMPDELSEQIRFERRHSRRLFGVRPTALLLWQAQSLAALRKAAWQVELLLSTALNKRQMNEVKARIRALEAVYRDAQPINPEEIPEALQVTTDQLMDDYVRTLENVNLVRDGAFYGPALESAEYTYGLPEELNLVAAFNGATYAARFDLDDPSDRQDPMRWLQPLALWIGELKRLRTAKLTKGIAASILAMLAGRNDDDNYDDDGRCHQQLDGLVRLVRDRLDDDVWAVLAQAAERFLNENTSQSPVVVYDWTRNINRAWLAEQRGDGTVVIEGPLLDFPRSRAAYWNETATTIVKSQKGVFWRRKV